MDPGCGPQASSLRGKAGCPRVPVRVLFIGVVVALSTLVLGGSAWFSYRQESRARRTALEQTLKSTADQAATSLALPMWYLDEIQVERILDNLMESSLVQEAAVQFQTGSGPVSTRIRISSGAVVKTTSLPFERKGAPGPGILEARREILHEGQVLGRARLVFATRSVEEGLRASLRHGLVSLALLDALLIAGLSYLLWRLMLRPLQDIHRLAELASRGARADLPGPDRVHVKELASLRDYLGRTFELLEERMASLEMSEERFRVLVESTSDLIFCLDLEGRLQSFNSSFAAHLRSSYGVEARLGEALERLLPPERIEPWRALFTRAVHGGAFRQEYELAGGTCLEVTFNPVTRGGRIQAYTIFGKDNTERKRAEGERRRLLEQLMQAQKLESLGNLAGGIAHDMNNVLAAVQAVTQTLKAVHAGEKELEASLEVIEKASTRGRDLVRGLTNFARREIREPEAVDLNTLAREEMEILRRTTEQKVELALELEAGLPAVFGDRAALATSLMNLCVNALDAMPGGGRLTLATGRAGDGWVRMQVRDTGRGMPAEVLSRAVEPFFTTKPIGKGTGLGLAMVYSTARAHGGTFLLESAPGQGTQATLRLPATTEPRASGPTPAGPAPAPKALLIMLVDDDELIRASVPGMLEQLGHQVLPVEGGARALELLEEGQPADLVILDLNMPGLNGAQTLGLLRQVRPEMPVLLATGHLDDPAADLVRRDPRVRSIGKPFCLDELGRSIQALMGPAP